MSGEPVIERVVVGHLCGQRAVGLSSACALYGGRRR
jgi:hypothetical protein